MRDMYVVATAAAALAPTTIWSMYGYNCLYVCGNAHMGLP